MVANACAIVGLLAIIVGLGAGVDARTAESLASVMFLGVAVGSIVCELLLVAVGQLVAAMLDTAKNTAEAAQHLSTLVARSSHTQLNNTPPS
jgi:putative Ca2+/H+ antiporter (TMEM165/GDT1 family)